MQFRTHPDSYWTVLRAVRERPGSTTADVAKAVGSRLMELDDVRQVLIDGLARGDIRKDTSTRAHRWFPAGHIATKRCYKCGLSKPLDDYHVSRNAKNVDGRLKKCKLCTNAATRRNRGALRERGSRAADADAFRRERLAAASQERQSEAFILHANARLRATTNANRPVFGRNV